MARAIKPQGRVGVVDYNAGGGGPGPAPDQRVDPDAVIKAATAAGLQLLAREALPPFQYVLVFGRPVTRQSAGMAPAAQRQLQQVRDDEGREASGECPRETARWLDENGQPADATGEYHRKPGTASPRTRTDTVDRIRAPQASQSQTPQSDTQEVTSRRPQEPRRALWERGRGGKYRDAGDSERQI